LIEHLSVRVSDVAANQIDEATAWWSIHRPGAPDAIADELERAFQILVVQPNIGSRARQARLEGVRRLHLLRNRYYIYYRLSGGSNIDILAFWHTSRGSAPQR